MELESVSLLNRMSDGMGCSECRKYHVISPYSKVHPFQNRKCLLIFAISNRHRYVKYMTYIPYNAEGFSIRQSPAGCTLPGRGTLSTNWCELAWAAITVGRANFTDVTRHNHWSLDEMMYRLLIVKANLAEDKAALCKSPAYSALEASEKGAVSYFIGQTMMHLLVSRCFNILWTLHAKVYGPSYNVQYSSSRRPDFIGQDFAGKWYVLESKGRSREFNQKAMNDAKIQTAGVSINGKSPHLSIVCQSHFTKSDMLNLRVAASAIKKDSLDRSIPELLLAQHHYHIVASALIHNVNSLKRVRVSPRYQLPEREYLVSPLLMGLRIGMEKELWDKFNWPKILKSRSESELKEPNEKPSNIRQYLGDRGLIFPTDDDGIKSPSHFASSDGLIVLENT